MTEATARALERNLDIAVERLNPQTFDLAISRLNAAYSPTLASVFGQRSNITPPTSTLNGGTRVDLDTTTYNAGLTQAVRWTGANIAFAFNNNKQVTSNSFVNYNPSFQNSFSLTAVQPLLRNFKIDSNRQQLRVTTINREVSDIQLRGTIATTLAPVRNAYWELVYSLQALESPVRSLELAEKLVDDNQRARRSRHAGAASTSCRQKPKRQRGGKRWHRPSRHCERRNWRSSDSSSTAPTIPCGVGITPTDHPSFAALPRSTSTPAVRLALTNRIDLEQGGRRSRRTTSR